MPLVIISIPLMVLAVGVAAIPLLVMSHRDHRDHRQRLESGEQRDHALALIEARGLAADPTTISPSSENSELPVAA